MTGSTIRGVRKGFSSGNFAASRIDDAGETTVVGGNSLHPGSATFQWPPADEVLSSQIAEFAPEVVEGRRGSGSSEGTLAPKSAVPAGESATEAARGCAGNVAGP